MRGDVKRATELVRTVENTLGWAPHNRRQRNLMIVAVLAKIEEQPTLYTWHNLALTVELLRRQRVQAGSPMFLFCKVQEAVDAAYIPVLVSTLAQLVEGAIEREQDRQLDGWQDWVGRLSRATGQGRQVAHDQWVAAGRAS